MNNKKHKSPRGPADTKQRLAQDVNSILSRCLHLFEEDVSFENDGHLDVDSVVSGREQVRIVSERRHSPPPQVRRQAATSFVPLTRANRGSFIPHYELARG